MTPTSEICAIALPHLLILQHPQRDLRCCCTMLSIKALRKSKECGKQVEYVSVGVCGGVCGYTGRVDWRSQAQSQSTLSREEERWRLRVGCVCVCAHARAPQSGCSSNSCQRKSGQRAASSVRHCWNTSCSSHLSETTCCSAPRECGVALTDPHNRNPHLFLPCFLGCKKKVWSRTITLTTL